MMLLLIIIAALILAPLVSGVIAIVIEFVSAMFTTTYVDTNTYDRDGYIVDDPSQIDHLGYRLDRFGKRIY